MYPIYSKYKKGFLTNNLAHEFQQHTVPHFISKFKLNVPKN
jgi:hypothetical protein